MNQMDDNFKSLVKYILLNGSVKKNRTNIDTLSIFGYQMKFDIGDYFPLLSLRKIHTKSIIHELLWFLGAYDDYEKFKNTNVRYLLDNGVTFWNEWVYKNYNKCREYRPELPLLTMKQFEDKIKNNDEFAYEFGDLGPIYGHQWLNWGGRIQEEIIKQGFDIIKDEKLNDIKYLKPDKIKKTVIDGKNQIDEVINLLKKDPDSRRIIIETWNVSDLDDMLLSPCHKSIQFYSRLMNPRERLYEFNKWCNKNNIKNNNITLENATKLYNFPNRKLSLQLYQRSTDVYLGLPYNIAEYSILLHLISKISNMLPHELIWTGGDVHLYVNSIHATKEIIQRDTKSQPIINISENINNIYDFRYEHIDIINYDYHPNIKVDVAI